MRCVASPEEEPVRQVHGTRRKTRRDAPEVVRPSLDLHSVEHLHASEGFRGVAQGSEVVAPMCVSRPIEGQQV